MVFFAGTVEHDPELLPFHATIRLTEHHPQFRRVNATLHAENLRQILQQKPHWSRFQDIEFMCSVVVECDFKYEDSFTTGYWIKITTFKAKLGLALTIRFGGENKVFKINMQRILNIYEDHGLSIRFYKDAISLPSGWSRPLKTECITNELLPRT